MLIITKIISRGLLHLAEIVLFFKYRSRNHKCPISNGKWLTYLQQMRKLLMTHVSAVLNYATTHSTDRLSSVNLLKNTNWGLLLYVTSTEC